MNKCKCNEEIGLPNNDLSSTINENLRVETLLCKIESSRLRWFRHLTSMSPGPCRSVSGIFHWTETYLPGEIIAHCWLRNVWGSPKRCWNPWLGIDMSELTEWWLIELLRLLPWWPPTGKVEAKKRTNEWSEIFLIRNINPIWTPANFPYLSCSKYGSNQFQDRSSHIPYHWLIWDFKI